MRRLKSCGVLCYTAGEPRRFLLMVRRRRGFDLPKGHIEEGETELECALRELWEETGITADHVSIDPAFRFETRYTFRTKRYGDAPVHKTLVIFLGELDDAAVMETVKHSREHKAFQWFDWPPAPIQKRTIDPLLAQVAEYWAEEQRGGGAGEPMTNDK